MLFRIFVSIKESFHTYEHNFWCPGPCENLQATMHITHDQELELMSNLSANDGRKSAEEQEAFKQHKVRRSRDILLQRLPDMLHYTRAGLSDWAGCTGALT